MANMHLVTGFAGYEHVTSADQGLFNSYIFGDLEVVMERGNMFEASIISNNIIRVKDGDLLMQGRFARLNDDSYVDLTIDNGTQGYFRNDLIVARYQKDVVTAVETVDLVVIKGENAESDPADPALVKGDIKFGKDFQNDIPLWRVSLDGLNVTGLTCLFSTFGSTLSKLKNHSDTHAVGGSDPLTLAMLGIGDYTHPASKVSIPAALAETIGSETNAEDALATLQKKGFSAEDYAWEVIQPSSVTYSVADTASYVIYYGSPAKVTYADTVSVSEDGTGLTLESPTTVSASASNTTPLEVLKGKFWVYGTSASAGLVYYTSEDDGKIKWSNVDMDTVMECNIPGRAVTPVTTPETLLDVVFSKNINAYPHDGEQNGLYYRMYGKYIEKTIHDKAKIQTGSYVGTGTSGASNPCSLTFSFVPKVFILRDNSSNDHSIWLAGMTNLCGVKICPVTVSDKTISWYYTSGVTGQMNTANTTYYWVAIG